MTELHDAICSALQKALRNSALPEPQLVANLVWELPKYINTISMPGAMKVSAGGVFVHARPFVATASFPQASPKSVEIGDLLFIRTLVQGDAVAERRALLLQVKKVAGIPAVPDNENQWHLYEKWPAFTYASRSGGLAGKGRRISEPDMYDAAKYLLIGADGCCQQNSCCDGAMWWRGYWPDVFAHYTAQPTRPNIGRYRVFAIELVDFLIGNAGKAFSAPASGAVGWDQVVYDLIAETAKAKSKFMERAAGNSRGAARGNMTWIFMTSAGKAHHYLVANGSGAMDADVPPIVPNEWAQDSDGDGISIIEVIVDRGSS